MINEANEAPAPKTGTGASPCLLTNHHYISELYSADTFMDVGWPAWPNRDAPNAAARFVDRDHLC